MSGSDANSTKLTLTARSVAGIGVGKGCVEVCANPGDATRNTVITMASEHSTAMASVPPVWFIMGDARLSMGMIIVKNEQLPTRADNTSVRRGGERRVDRR